MHFVYYVSELFRKCENEYLLRISLIAKVLNNNEIFKTNNSYSLSSIKNMKQN